MRQIFTFIIIFSLAQVYAQDNPFIAKQTRVIDSLYNKNLLKKKEYDGRTFVGSLSGYYFKDTLVYVNTLTDGEYGGVETKYYCKDTTLMKVKSMSTQFADPNEWTEYYKKHKKNQNCNSCHSKVNCNTTTIVFTKQISINSTIKGKKVKVDDASRKTEIATTFETFKVIRTLLDKL